MRTRSEEPGFAVSTSGSSGNASMADRAGLHQAPRLLPLLHRMEERAGERRCVFIGFPSPRSSPLVPRGERMESLMQPWLTIPFGGAPPIIPEVGLDGFR